MGSIYPGLRRGNGSINPSWHKLVQRGLVISLCYAADLPLVFNDLKPRKLDL